MALALSSGQGIRGREDEMQNTPASHPAGVLMQIDESLLLNEIKRLALIALPFDAAQTLHDFGRVHRIYLRGKRAKRRASSRQINGAFSGLPILSRSQRERWFLLGLFGIQRRLIQIRRIHHRHIAQIAV